MSLLQPRDDPAPRWDVAISRTRYPAHVDCEQCSELEAEPTRAQVRAHVRDTGHTVWVVVEDSTRYAPGTVLSTGTGERP